MKKFTSKKSILLLLLALLFSPFLHAQVYNGHPYLINQAQVDAFNYTEVTGNLYIFGHDITNLDGLSSLTTVGGDLDIDNNPALTNVDGLSSLTTVGGALEIYLNNALTNIDGLSSLTTVGGDLYIAFNLALTEFCGLYPLFNGGGLSGPYFVFSNANNPTQQEIIDGGICGLNAVCKSAVVSLDERGAGTLAVIDIDGGSTADYGIASLELSKTDFSCDDIDSEITVTLTVTDVDGNTDECTANVIVEDTIAPMIDCPSDITINTDVTLLASYPLIEDLKDHTNKNSDVALLGHPTPPAMPVIGSPFYSNGIYYFNPDGQDVRFPEITDFDFDMFLLGIDFNLTTYDAYYRPVIVGGLNSRWIGFGVNPTGKIGIKYNNSHFVWSTTTINLDQWYSAQLKFNEGTVVLLLDGVEVLSYYTGELNHWNSSSFLTNEYANGKAFHGYLRNFKIYNYVPGCGAEVTFDQPTFSDNCLSEITQTDGLPGGSVFPVGTTTNTYIATDASGNTASCSFNVTVEDNAPPEAICQDVTVQLDENGNGTTIATLVDDGSNDACGIASLELDITEFTCEDFGENSVVLTVTDNHENSSTCETTVTVEDNVEPAINCTPLEIVLYKNGEYVLNENDIAFMAAGTFDNCTSFDDLVLDVFPKSFECVHVGEPVIVQLLAIDQSGNESICRTTVIVYDETPPVTLCKDLDLFLDESGKARINPSKVNAGDGTVVLPGWARTYNDMSGGSYDACGISSLIIDQYNFDCSDIGENTVTLTVVDGHGNTSTCESTVTVSDNIIPVIESVADVELVLEPGKCKTEVEYPALVVTDNCETTLELTEGLGPDGVFPVGTTTETWLATDDAGNTASVSFDITIVSTNTLPTIDEVTNITIEEDINSVEVTLTGISEGDDCEEQDVTVTATGDNAELITSVTVDYTAGDSIGIITMEVSPEMSGEAEIIVTVEDEEGGTTTDTFMVTVTAVNDAPVLLHAIADETVNASYELKVPISSVLGEMFDDIDDDTLTIEVVAEGTDSLPAWAMMMDDTLVCTPAITDTGCVNIVVTAIDAGGLSVSDTFEVCIDGYPVSIGDLGMNKFEVQMYPNPTRGKVNMDISSGIYDVQLSVMDITGKVVLQKQYSASENITFDMSGKVSGMYFVKMNIDGNQMVKKLIVDRK